MSGVETGDGVELFLLPVALFGSVKEPCERVILYREKENEKNHEKLLETRKRVKLSDEIL